MNRIWLLFEKIFAVIEIVSAGLFIYVDCVNERDQPLSQILKDTNIHVLYILHVVGGILLLFNKKTGWIISVPMWALFVIGFDILSFSDGEIDWTVLILFSIMGIAFLVFILQKPFLKKYQISKKDWIIIAGIAPVIVIFACWHHLF